MESVLSRMNKMANNLACKFIPPDRVGETSPPWRGLPGCDYRDYWQPGWLPQVHLRALLITSYIAGPQGISLRSLPTPYNTTVTMSEENTEKSTWDELVGELGVNVTDDALERRQPAPKELPTQPS